MGTKNVVIFGPAHSGKSTLAGYWYYLGMDEISRKKMISWFEKNIDKYDPEQKFAYFYDTHKDERFRKKDNEKDKRSTSKYTKVKKIKVDDIEIGVIDTPGDRNAIRERFKGIFFGEVGLFVIDINKLPEIGSQLLTSDNANELRDITTPLNVWLKFKKKENLIVVLSKMDKSNTNFSKEAFDKAVEKLKWFTGEEFPAIIPLSIIVDKEIDHNFVTKSDKLLWYENSTLFNKIQQLVHETKELTPLDKPLFMYIDDQYKDVKGTGNIWRGKVLQGKLEVNSKVIVSPIKYSKNGMFITPSANIKSIKRATDDENIDTARTGDIVTIDVNDVRLDNSRIDKKDLESIRTTCIFGYGSQYLSGNILNFEVDPQFMSEVSINEVIHILWFGRFLPCEIVNKELHDNKGIITVLISNDLIASLPVNENGQPLYYKFLLDNHSEPPNYAEATLINIGFLKDVSLHVRNLTDRNIKTVKLNFKQFSPIIEDNTIKFSSLQLIPIIHRVKKHFDEKSIDSGECKINIELEYSNIKL